MGNRALLAHLPSERARERSAASPIATFLPVATKDDEQLVSALAVVTACAGWITYTRNAVHRKGRKSPDPIPPHVAYILAHRASRGQTSHFALSCNEFKAHADIIDERLLFPLLHHMRITYDTSAFGRMEQRADRPV